MTTEKLPDHFPFGPSSADRWLTCHQSVELSKGIESRSSSYANLGTVAHDLAAEWLETNKRPDTPVICADCNRLLITPPCVHCGCQVQKTDDEMLGYVGEYVTPIQRIKLVQQATLHIETKMQSKQFRDFGGTADAVLQYWNLEDGNVLWVWDYKHGQGYAVAAQGNTQTLAYLVLARETYGRVDTYRTTIVQPRADNYEDYESSTDEYTNEHLDAFEKRILDALTGNNLVAGDHCRWCPASAVGCPALKEMQTKIAQTEFNGDSTNEELAWVLAHADVIKSTLKNAYDEALARATEGQLIPGFKLVEGLGNRTWISDEDTTARKLRQRGIKKADMYLTQLKSPAQIEKTVDKAAAKTIVDGIVFRPKRGTKLVSVDKPGEALHPGSPGDEFI